MNRILRIYLKSFDYYLLNIICFNIISNSIKFKCKIKGPVYIPNRIEKYNILRSPHVNKKSRDQFQICWHKRFIDLYIFNCNFLIFIKNIFIFYNLDFFLEFLKC